MWHGFLDLKYKKPPTLRSMLAPNCWMQQPGNFAPPFRCLRIISVRLAPGSRDLKPGLPFPDPDCQAPHCSAACHWCSIMSLCRTREEFCIGSHDREGSASVNFMNFVKTGAKLEIFVTKWDWKMENHEKMQRAKPLNGGRLPSNHFRFQSQSRHYNRHTDMRVAQQSFLLKTDWEK